MKRLFPVFILLLLPSLAFCQLGISYHQSNLSFAAIRYEIKDHLKPEIRVGTDRYFTGFSLEGDVSYDVLQKEDYEAYLGVGFYGTSNFQMLTIPVGLNIFPFENKNFGFLLEVSPMIGTENILRGSWGIQYRFGN